MAIVVKKSVIYVDLSGSVDYAFDSQKTTDFFDKIEYALDTEKTEKRLYTSAINCDSGDTAYQEMLEAKENFRKVDKRLGYHYIQSFHPDEPITPKLAHEIGIRLAEEFWGARFQVAVGTHLNEEHLHNHFVVNSVSFVDGLKYRDKKDYLLQLRAISDKLCLEYGFSVIEPKAINSTEPYEDWKDRQNGTPPRNDTMREDIDDCIRQSLSFEEFIARMRGYGYTFRYGPNITHMSIKAPGAERARRVYKLGEEYSEEAIRHRIGENTPEEVMAVRQPACQAPQMPNNSHALPKTVRAFRDKKYSRKKLKGLQARYYRILYTFGMIRKRPRASVESRAMYFSMYDQIRQFEGYVRQMRLLSANDIKSIDELTGFRESAENVIIALIAERRTLYRSPENATGGLKEEIDLLTEKLTGLRLVVRDCNAIEARSNATLQRIREAERKNSLQKNVHER